MTKLLSTVPNWLSIYRMVAAPVIIVFIFLNYRLLSGGLILISLFTDALDGWIARKTNTETQIGAKLDTIGDLITIIVGLIAVAVFEWAFVKEHLMVIVITFGLYLIQVIIALIRFGKPTSFHTISAKTAAVALAIFILTFIFYGTVEWIFYVTMGGCALDAIEDITLTFMLDKNKQNVKGIYWVLKDKSHS